MRYQGVEGSSRTLSLGPARLILGGKPRVRSGRDRQSAAQVGAHGHRVAGVHRWHEQAVMVAGEPVDTRLGGLPAKRIDLSVPDDLDAAACRMGEHLQIWYSPPADKYFVLLGDGMASVYVLDVDGERQVFLTQYRAGATPEDVAEMDTILESIEIDS